MRSSLILLFSLLTLCSCSPQLAPSRRITVSIEPLRYFVESIAGEHFQVNTLVPAGSSPETYELTPQQVVDMNESEAYFAVGTLGFEKTRLAQLAEHHRHLLMVNVSDSIPLMQLNEGACTHHGHPHQHSDGTDLHTWASTSSGRKIARAVLKALVQIDSLHANDYQQRHDSLQLHIDHLEAQIKEMLRPLKHRSFLIYHPALGYFARDYGLQQIAVEQDGKEPSADRMQQLVDLARHEGIRTVFIQEEYAGHSAQRVAEAIGGRVVRCAPLSVHWDKQLLHIARQLAQ